MARKNIIPIFIPHYGCPHCCIFCDQNAITGMKGEITAAYVEEILETQLNAAGVGLPIEAALYGGSFTALPLTKQAELLAPLKKAVEDGRIKEIRLSTRPDAISSEIMELLMVNYVTAVELGIQSLDDDVLSAANRGHSADDAVQAAEILTRYPIVWGIQLMPGLPGEDWQSLLLTAVRAVALKPHMARIYPTLVLDGTALAVEYSAGRYVPLTLEEGVRRAAFLKALLERCGIKVIRTGLQPTDELSRGGLLMAGPYHPSFGELTESFIWLQVIIRALAEISPTEKIFLHCHPRDESKIRGQRNSNLQRLYEMTAGNAVVRADGKKQGRIDAVHCNTSFIIERNAIYRL